MKKEKEVTVETMWEKFSEPFPRFGHYLCGEDEKNFKKFLKQFAKHHVKEALKEAANTLQEWNNGFNNPIQVSSTEEILNAYDLKNVK